MQRLCIVCALTLGCAPVFGQASFVNWETPHVHPLDQTPDGTRLLAVNLPDARLEVYDITADIPVLIGEVPVGVDPVTVRARTDSEAWVVNHISDTISIVDLTTMNVVATLNTDDEPCDVVFAGAPQRAFVSCEQPSTVNVFDPADLSLPPTKFELVGEDPRAMAVSPDGSLVYVAIFSSGNRTTILGAHGQGRVVSAPNGPWGGQNPPPNDGDEFNPPIRKDLPEPPPLGLIVQKQADGRWIDDNGGDWTDFVSGPLAYQSSRVEGWDVIDNDVAVIDANTLAVSYLTDMMNLVMAIDVRPNGQVSAVGLESTNLIRFEPVLKARFVRVHMATGSTASPNAHTIVDLNPHLDYSDEQIAQQADPGTADQGLRDLSIGDPRAIVWRSNGTVGFVAGMGSNNVIRIDSSGNRLGDPIEVGEGPTGLSLKESEGLLYVMNKFDGSISVVDINQSTELARLSMFDPTPEVVKAGRPFQYDTHRTSGLGQLACASCHVDARVDRIAWDLGNPQGDLVPFGDNCSYGVEGPCDTFHPMKSVMLTQTLQDIIGHEPLHWRGDKPGLENFNGAFTGLQGDDVMLTEEEMQAYEDFLATIYIQPNPYRNFDNTLPDYLDLTGHYSDGVFFFEGGLARGEPLPPGNPQEGLRTFNEDVMHQAGPGGGQTRCVTCHTLPTGLGADVKFVGDLDLYPEPGSGVFEYIPTGPAGEHHLMSTGLKFSGERRTAKVPQLRTLYDRVGYEMSQTVSKSGFGFFQDGGDTLSMFISRFGDTAVGGVQDDQHVADILSFLLCLSGSDLPVGALDDLPHPPGPSSQDTHAAVGKQVTVTELNKNDADVIDWIGDVVTMSDAMSRVAMIAKGVVDGELRGYYYLGGGLMQSDRLDETIAVDDLRLAAVAGGEITFTVVPFGTQIRMGVDRDEDSYFDRDELDACADAADAASTPATVEVDGDADGDEDIDLVDYASFNGCLAGPDAGLDGTCGCTADIDRDGDVDLADTSELLIGFTGE